MMEGECDEERSSHFDYQEERKALLDYTLHLENRTTKKFSFFQTHLAYLLYFIIATIPIYFRTLDSVSGTIETTIVIVTWLFIWFLALIYVYYKYIKPNKENLNQKKKEFDKIITSIIRKDKDNDEIHDMIKNLKKSEK